MKPKKPCPICKREMTKMGRGFFCPYCDLDFKMIAWRQALDKWL